MGIALYSDFGKNEQGGITTVAIDRLDELTSTFFGHTPYFAIKIVGLFRGYMISEHDNNGYPG